MPCLERETGKERAVSHQNGRLELVQRSDDLIERKADGKQMAGIVT